VPDVLGYLDGLTRNERGRYLLALETIASVRNIRRADVDVAMAQQLAAGLLEPVERLTSYLSERRDVLHEERDRILGLDATFETFLGEQFGQEGAATAQALRAGAALRWGGYKVSGSNRDLSLLLHPWVSASGRALMALAQLVYGRQTFTAEVSQGESLEAEMGVDARLLRSMFSAYWDVTLPTVDLGARQRTLNVTSTVAFHRAFRWLLRQPHASASQPDVIVSARAVAALRKKLLPRKRDAAAVVKACLGAMAQIALELPDGRVAPLLSSLQFAAGEIRMQIDKGALPPYPGQARVVPIPPLPRFVGSRKSHGAQAALQVLFAIELPLPPGEQLKDYYSVTPLDLWEELAATAGVPRRLLAAVSASWVSRPRKPAQPSSKSGEK
jgi:hypothetical protein